MELLKIFVILVILVLCSKADVVIPEYILNNREHACYLVLPSHEDPIEFKSTRTNNEYSFEYYREQSLLDREERDKVTKLLNHGGDNEELVVTGRYTYTTGSNTVYVMYEADKNGYRAKVYSRIFPCALAGSIKLLKSLVG